MNDNKLREALQRLVVGEAIGSSCMYCKEFDPNCGVGRLHSRDCPIVLGRAALADSATADNMICEAHPWLPWPHDECGGPGCPPSAAVGIMRQKVRALQIAVQAREAMIVSAYNATADAPPEPTEEMVRAGVCAVTADTFNQYLTLEDRMSIVRSILRKAALTAQKEG